MNKDESLNANKPQRTLRDRAEKMLRASRADIAGMSPDDIKRMIHELQVHQMELKLQNEELLQSQTELAHSRDQLNDLFEFAPVGYLTLDSHGVIFRANLTATKMFGLERTKVIGRKLTDFVGPGSQDECFRHLQEVFSGDEKCNCELTMFLGGKSERLAQLESQVVGRSDIQHRQCRAALIDITEQREATEWMIQAKRLRAMVENLPAGAVFVDHDRIEINQGVEEMTGFLRSELQTVDQWFSNLYRSRESEIRKQYEADRSSGFLKPALVSITRKDGKQRTIEIISHGFADHEVWLLHDVTEKKVIEESLRRERELTESMVNTAQNIILVLDPVGKVVRFNPYFETLTGWKLNDLKGCDWFATCITEPEHDIVKARFDNAISGTRTVAQTNYLKCSNGSLREIEWHDAKLVNDAGEIVGLLCSGQDITDRKLLERHVLSIADEQQRRTGRDLHDGVGQELTGLAMMAQSLALDLSEKLIPEAKVAKTIAEQVEESLQQVRSLARGLNPVDVEPNGLDSALSELARHVSDLYGINCSFDCHEQVEVNNSDTATNLFRIAQEAITNAAKHGKPENIRIELRVSDNLLVLSILDDGIGIQNLDAIRTGVGMRSLRYRADLIGGRLSVKPGSRKGTVVSCEIPVG